MFRWSILLPRLLMLAVMVCALLLGAESAVRWRVVESLTANSSLQLKAGRFSANLRAHTASMEHVAVIDPQRPETPVADVEQVDLKLDPRALARGQVVVETGELRGLRMQAPTPSTAWLRDCRSAPADGAAALGQAWSDAVTIQQPEQLERTLPSIQAIRDHSQRWNAEFERIIAAASNWQIEFDELDRLVSRVRDNPLRMTPEYRRRLEELAGVGRDLDRLTAALQTLSDRIVAEHQTLQAQRDSDLESLSVEQSLGEIDSNCLSHYLLEAPWRQELAHWMSWVGALQQAPRAMPQRRRLSRSNSRGVDVLFNASREPGLLLKSLALQGMITVGEQPFQFHGTMQDLCDQPASLNRPAVLRLSAQGRSAMQLEAILDRRGPVANDEIRIVCAQLQTPRRTLGRPDHFSVDVTPGVTRVAMLVEIEGDRLRGRLDFSQSDAQLTPQWPGSPQPSEPLSDSVRLALQDIDEVAGSIRLTGSVEFPVWTLDSDLGDQVARRVRGVLEQELQGRTAEVQQRGRQLLAAEFERAYQSLKQYEATVDTQLQSKDRELAKFLERIKSRTDLMDQLVRNAGPLENLLR